MRRAIAIDFDGCICQSKYPEIGKPNWHVIEEAKKEQAAQIKSHAVHQVIESPVEEHSKKPEETRRRIVELLGDVPRIELFARQRSPGWDAWGNEIGEQDEK